MSWSGREGQDLARAKRPAVLKHAREAVDAGGAGRSEAYPIAQIFGGFGEKSGPSEQNAKRRLCPLHRIGILRDLLGA